MKITQRFSDLKPKNEAAFIPYITAGYPSLGESLDIVETLSQNGADIIEIGYPFSDPVADGKTIQQSSQAALSGGITLKETLDALSARKIDAPLVLMSYLNPLMAYGHKELLPDLASAGISGLIIPDMPVEEAEDWLVETKAYGIDLILLVTPTSPPERVRKITQISSGFIYCVSIAGITGARNQLPADISEFLSLIRSMTDKPLAVGFGISTPDQIRTLRRSADGIIIGSRIIKAISEKEDLASLVREFKAATRR